MLYAIRAMHKLGYARIPAAMCPRDPRMWRMKGMNAEHNETVGQASADINRPRCVGSDQFTPYAEFKHVHETRPRMMTVVH